MSIPVGGVDGSVGRDLAAELAECERQLKAFQTTDKKRTKAASRARDEESERKTKEMEAKVAEVFSKRATLAQEFKKNRSSKTLRRSLKAAGAIHIRTTGSHKIYSLHGTTITVPFNSRGELPPGTRSAIAKEIKKNGAVAKF